MKLAVALAGLVALSGIGMVGAEALAQACGLAHLQAPSAEMATLEAVPDLRLEPVTDTPLGEGLDTHSCQGKIRPGVRMTSPAGCTMSWVFRDQNALFYQTTAGHCVASVGQSVNVLGISGRIGEVVYRVNGGVGRDIAVVKIDLDKYGLVEPTLCHWGGPTGVATGPQGEHFGQVDGVLHYGWGVMWQNQPTRARAGALPVGDWYRAPDGSSGSIQMTGFTDGGDSGSPMMLKTGLAAGVHTHRLDIGPAGFGKKAATRLDVWLPHIEASTGLRLTIEQGLPVDLTGQSIPP